MFDILSNFAEFDDQRLDEYLAEVRAAFQSIAESEDDLTDAQLDEAEALADHIEAIVTEQGNRSDAAAARADRAAALRNRFQQDQDEAAAEEDEIEEDPEVVEGEVVEVEDEVEEVAAAAPPARKRTPRAVAIARKVPRPEKPAANRSPVVITAAADVPEFATGSRIEDLTMLGQAAINRMRGFPAPNGDGEREDLHMYGTGMLRMEFPEDLQIGFKTADDMEVLYHAIDESRLPSGSLVAAGGWCAPSETLYDLCAGETTEGMVSVPEVQVSRGGIKYTSGPDFGTIYSNIGFSQTEAQAISGTTKPCFEVPCPSFTEVRLDVVGLCLKVPILTSVGYPELIQRWMSGSMIAHQHKVNAKVIAALATAAGTAKTITAHGTTAGDTVDALALIADGIRSKYRLGMSASMEVVLPWFAKGAMQADLDNRSYAGQSTVDGLFASRNLSPQWVYDWQDSSFPAGTAPAIAYPANVTALIYPAGTFIKGVSDVINLSAVYDAASLATNVYTGLFYEQGVLIAKMCYEAQAVTIPICNAGATGPHTLAC